MKKRRSLRSNARKHILSGISVLVVLIAAIAWIRIEVLKIPLASSAAVVYVDLPQTGGFYAGADVTYRGTAVGRVTSMRLTASGVEAKIGLNPGVQVPRNTQVLVRSLSPVGEQYLDFQPKTSSGPFLASGTHIQGTASDLPQTVADATQALNKLLNQVDPRQLQVLVSEASQAVGGIGNQIATLLSNTSQLATAYNSELPTIEAMLGDARTVLQTGVDSAAQLAIAASSAKTFTAWLRQFSPALFAAVQNDPTQLVELQKLVADLTANLPALFNSATPLEQLIVSHDPHLRTLLQAFPISVAGLAATLEGGSQHIAIVVRRGDLCIYNVKERKPTDIAYRPLQDGGRCPMNTVGQQRGAQFAPGPTR